MPLTAFQKQIFRLISSHRNPDSYVAGGITINRSDLSLRFSSDIDLFHEKAAAVGTSADADASSLRAAGLVVSFLRREATFIQALVRSGDQEMRLDWALDSAFRFYPLVSDEMLGYRLHDVDAATNKVLAAAGRQKVRDFIDLIQLDSTSICLGVAVWAASGKDEGYTSSLIMHELRRNSQINPATLGDVTFAKDESPIALKAKWLERFAAAERLIASIPDAPLGCLYLNPKGEPARGEVFDPTWTPHFGSVKGAWPKIGE